MNIAVLDGLSTTMQKAAAEYAFWATKIVYSTLRRHYPSAVTARVALYDVCVFEALYTADGDEIPLEETVDIAGNVDRAARVLDTAVALCGADNLPGARETGRASGVYDLDLTSFPDGTPNPPEKLTHVLRDTVDTWPMTSRWALMTYSEGLLRGLFRPLTDLNQWPLVPGRLELAVPAARPGDGRPDAEDWQNAIQVVHGLAKGVLFEIQSITTLGTPTGLAHYVDVYQDLLDQHGVSLDWMASACAGDVYAAALAINRI
jgi:hypothetical protein